MRRFIAATCLAAAATVAAAHDDHKPQHGGIVAPAKAFDVEIVVRPDTAQVWLSDHGKPLPAAGANGKLTLLAGGAKTEAALRPAGDHLAAQGRFPKAKGTKGIVLINAPGKPATTVRFAIP